MSSATSRRKLVSWNASPSAIACGSASLRAHAGRGAEHRQHLQPDDRRRAPHVPVQRRQVRIAVDVEVAGHRGEEVDEVLDGDLVAAVGVHQGQPHRVVGPAALQLGQHRPRPVGEVAGRVGAGQVDEVVGGAGGGVERVHRRPPVGGEQPGGQVVALAEPGVDGRAVPVGGGQLLLPSGDAVIVIRSAASRRHHHRHATPGCTDEPARTTFSGPAAGSRAGTGRSGRRCGPGRTGCRPPCPARPSRAAWPSPRPRSRRSARPAARLQGASTSSR